MGWHRSQPKGQAFAWALAPFPSPSALLGSPCARTFSFAQGPDFWPLGLCAFPSRCNALPDSAPHHHTRAQLFLVLSGSAGAAQWGRPSTAGRVQTPAPRLLGAGGRSAQPRHSVRSEDKPSAPAGSRGSAPRDLGGKRSEGERPPPAGRGGSGPAGPRPPPGLSRSGRSRRGRADAECGHGAAESRRPPRPEGSPPRRDPRGSLEAESRPAVILGLSFLIRPAGAGSQLLQGWVGLCLLPQQK